MAARRRPTAKAEAKVEVVEPETTEVETVEDVVEPEAADVVEPETVEDAEGDAPDADGQDEDEDEDGDDVEDVTAGARLVSPDGDVHLIVPAGVAALLALGWTRAD